MGLKVQSSEFGVRRSVFRPGFTIIELLVVVSVIAVLATLGTGAALKAVKSSRVKRIDAAARTLETALASYRSLNGQWPYKFNNPDNAPSCIRTGLASYVPTETWGVYSHSPHTGCSGVKARHKGEKNHEVFAAVLEELKDGRALLETSGIMVRARGSRMTLREALERKVSADDIVIGYPHPSNQNTFIPFKIVYNYRLDTVSVGRDDDAEDGKTN